MKIALATEGNSICGHFGHCERFALYDTESKEWNYVANPGHQPGYLPEYLSGLNVDLVIAGGMGARAQELFTDRNIPVIVGIQGNLKEVIKQYEQGKLVSSGVVCQEHMHAGDCHANK
jgi:predicted Fe-Mo cluster-binding NifX family protein